MSSGDKPRQPTIIKGPLPGEAVELHRVRHGALPGELDECPFCGQDEAAYRFEQRNGLRSKGQGGPGHYVKCLHCGSQSPYTATQEGARTVWNSRAEAARSSSAPALREALEDQRDAWIDTRDNPAADDWIKGFAQQCIDAADRALAVPESAPVTTAGEYVGGHPDSPQTE